MGEDQCVITRFFSYALMIVLSIFSVVGYQTMNDSTALPNSHQLEILNEWQLSCTRLGYI